MAPMRGRSEVGIARVRGRNKWRRCGVGVGSGSHGCGVAINGADVGSQWGRDRTGAGSQ